MRARFLPLLLALPAMVPAAAPVLGKLGQTTERVTLYASPTTRAHAYYRTTKYQYVIVRPRTTKAGWVRVLMATGIDGYAKEDHIHLLPYDVTQRTEPLPSASGRRAPLASRGVGLSVAGYSLQFRGTPYVWGGDDPQRGIDCSGFVKQMYGTVGVNLPRTAAEQALVGEPITRLEHLQAGDRLYFWEAGRAKIGHTGIYLGNGYFVHSSRGHNGVATDFLSERWRKILVAARR
ncbi:MAG: hypothetical protein C4320_05085 [Armatimonadota bacterium]